MQKTSTFLSTLTLLALGTSSSIGDAQAQGSKMEKCYGIVKAGLNDCADAAGRHSCAGYSKVDGEWSEWMLLPEGNCEKIVGASVEPNRPKSSGENGDG